VQANVFEIGVAVVNGGFYHNTIWNPEGDNGSALATCANNFRVENNLFYGGTTHRCDGLNNNLQITDASWFEDVNNWNFQLTENRTAPDVGVTEDILGYTRADPPTAGAYEFGGSTAIIPVNQIKSQADYSLKFFYLSGASNTSSMCPEGTSVRPIYNYTGKRWNLWLTPEGYSFLPNGWYIVMCSKP
jgi:hypothetical protein